MNSIIAVFLLFFSACGSAEPAEPELIELGPVRITSQQAKEMIEEFDVIILDVRTPEEFAGGHIENAVLIPVNELEYLIFDVIENKDQTLLIYCRSGNRSHHAAWTLADLGFTSVYDFGGILTWEGVIVTP